MVISAAVTRGKQWLARSQWHRLTGEERESTTCVVLGNGPSLADIDPSDVRDFVRIHVNDYRPWSAATGLMPHILVMQDRHAFANYPEAISSALEGGARVYVPLSYAGKFTWLNLTSGRINFFAISDRPSTSQSLDVPGLTVAANYTVTATAIEVASYLGYTRIALLGCDNRYVIPPGSTSDSWAGSAAPTYQLPTGSTDPNHFGSPTFKDGSLAYFPDPKLHEESYRTAAERAHARGSTVVNCSTRGSIRSLPALQLTEFLTLDM